MNVGIVGSGNYADYANFSAVIKDVLVKYPSIDVIVSGGAKGVDSMGAQFARENGIDLKTFLPDWKKYGRSAGPKRNTLIIESSDMVVGFWDFASSGTKD